MSAASRSRLLAASAGWAHGQPWQAWGMIVGIGVDITEISPGAGGAAADACAGIPVVR